MILVHARGFPQIISGIVHINIPKINNLCIVNDPIHKDKLGAVQKSYQSPKGG